MCVRVHCLRKRFCVRGVKLIGFICVQQHGIFIVIFFFCFPTGPIFRRRKPHVFIQTTFHLTRCTAGCH